MSTDEGGVGARRRPAETAAWALLVPLLLLDLALLGRHLSLVEGGQVFTHPWSVEADGSYPELLQYLKWLGAVLLLAALAFRRRAAIYVGWAAIFLYFLVDDSTELHERLGAEVVGALNLDRLQQLVAERFPDLFVRARDFGELAVALGAAAVVAVVLGAAWPAREARRDRRTALRLLLWLAAFAFFAVGVDMVHVMTIDPVTGLTPSFYWLGLIEDGGEMICASLLLGGLAAELARG